MKTMQSVYQEMYQRISAMTPEQRALFTQQLRHKLRQLPPSFQKLAVEEEQRLQQRDPRTPPNLSGWSDTVANLAQAATAVAGAYLAYEGMKQAREDRSRERSAAERAAAEAEAMAAAQQAAVEATFNVPGRATPTRTSYLPWVVAGVAGLGLIAVVLIARKKS